jgi:tetratricopeptide (TPR) repeat protein
MADRLAPPSPTDWTAIAGRPDSVDSVGPPNPPSPAAPLRWRRDLDVAEAEAALLIGRLLWDATGRRDSSAAEEFFDRAARRAAQAGDSVLQVTAFLRAAFVGLYGGDPRAGVRRCVQAAVIAAPVSDALFGLARLHAAEGHALLGHAAECDRALTTARGALAAISADDPAPGVCQPRTYQRLAGAAHLALGRHTEARAALTEAATRYEPGKILALVLGQLALACLGEGDTGAALRHTRTAIELAEVTHSVGAMAVAFRAGREIVRGCGGAEPEALEIVDQLLTVVAA